MSIKATLAAIKAMGGKARWDIDWREYRVTMPGLSAEREEAIAYYCSDPQEAIDAASHMASVGAA